MSTQTHTCPECAETTGPHGTIQHTSACPIEVADQTAVEADRAQLQSSGGVGYERPVTDGERAKLTTDGHDVAPGATTLVGTLSVNGQVVNPRMVMRQWTGLTPRSQA